MKEPFGHRHPVLYIALSAIPALILAWLLYMAYQHDIKRGVKPTVPAEALHLAG